MINLLNVVRAFDGVMFSREAWDALSRLNIRTGCQIMPYGQGGPSGEGALRLEMGPLPRARPAQGHYSFPNAQRLLPQIKGFAFADPQPYFISHEPHFCGSAKEGEVQSELHGKGKRRLRSAERKQTLRVWERIMPLRGAGGTGDTSSGRRCPPCGSPLAVWHKPTARFCIQPRPYNPRFAAKHDAIECADYIQQLNHIDIKTRFHYTVAL